MWQQHSEHEELLWKLMRFPVFEMKMESREWENWLSLQRCPPATIKFVKPSCFSILNKKEAWTGSEQMQFGGSTSDWCSSLMRKFSRDLAEPAGSMNSSSYSKETPSELHKVVHIPLCCAELGRHARETWKPEGKGLLCGLLGHTYRCTYTEW